MSDKRFTTNGYYIYDHFKEDKWLVNEVEAEEIVTVMNNLDIKARERSKALSKLQKENEQLKKENNKLHQKIFEMRTNIALERTEISRQTYTGKKNEKEYLDVKEFLDEIEKW